MSFVEGKGFVQRASDLGFEEAALNMPISEGDRIGTSDGRLEVHFGKGNYIRLDNDTKVDVLNLPKKDDDVARIRVWSGNVFLVVGTLKKEKGIELHTADSSFYVLDRGVYRVDVRENRDTEMQVYQGLIEVAGEDGSTLLKASQKLEISEGRFTAKPSSFIAVADDSFDKFNESRTSVTGREYAKGRLPEELSDYEGELDANGKWTYLAPYGNVWMPNGVDNDWRPYYNGRWSWLPLSGWTWWPYEPWGWSTSHYGRWHWGIDLGWYWIPMSMWGPAWVDWWWDDFYFGWAPLSYWGYPGILMGGQYFGHYYGAYYPHQSRALTVVRRDHLKDPHIAANALRGDSLKGLNRMSLTSRNLSLRPAGTKISVEPMNGNRVMLRNGGTTGLTKDGRIGREAVGRTAVAGQNPRAIRGPDAPAKTQGTTKGTPATKPQSVKSPSKGEKSSGTARTGSSSGRNIRKKDGSPATAESSVGGYRSDPSVAGTGARVGTTRNVNGYPSSPRIKAPVSSYGERRQRRDPDDVRLLFPAFLGSLGRPALVRPFERLLSEVGQVPALVLRASRAAAPRAAAPRAVPVPRPGARPRVPEAHRAEAPGEDKPATPFHRGRPSPHGRLGRDAHFFLSPISGGSIPRRRWISPRTPSVLFGGLVVRIIIEDAQVIGERAIPGRFRPGHEHLAEREAADGRRQQARLLIDLDEDQVRRHLEIRRREVDDAVGLGFGPGISDDRGEEIHPDRQRRGRAGLPFPERDRQVMADPDAGAQVRREADEPGVRILVGRPRLSGQRPGEDGRGPGRPALSLDDAAHQVGHHVGRLGRDDLLGFDPGLLEDVAVLVLDPGDEIGHEPDAFVREGRVGRHHFEQGDLERPQAEREVRVNRRGDAEAAAIIDADLRRDEIEELRRDDVPGLLEAGSQGDGALVLPVVVLGRPGFVVPAVDEGHRLVGDARWPG